MKVISRFADIGPGIRAILTVLVVLSLDGCSSTTIESWSEESYRSPSFTAPTLNDGGMALMPVIVLQGRGPATTQTSPSKPAPYAPSQPATDSGKETDVKETSGYRVIFDEALLSRLKSRWPGLKLITSGDVLKQLNDAGLGELYTRFDNKFATAGLDGETLEKFGAALQVRYLFVSRVIVSETTSDASISFIWSFGRKSEMRSLKVISQIWDTSEQQQVWEGSGVAFNRLDAYEQPPLTEQMAVAAVHEVVDALQP